MDALQEKIRKTKCPIVVDMSILTEHIPSRFAIATPVEAMAAFCRELMAGLKELVPGVRFSFDQFALMDVAGLQTLSELLREARDLAVLTERYYDRGYHRNAKYTV
jgi:hypothetical protein